MSAPTFKVGDRVRISTPGYSLYGKAGHVDAMSAGRVTVLDEHKPPKWCATIDGSDLRLAPPMSPEAKMVWHAMRAGAKRTARIHITSMNGTCYRVRQYTSGSIALRVEIALPPLAEDEAGR